MGSISTADAIAMQERLSRATRKTHPVPVSRPAMKERELHDAIMDECRRRGWFAVHSRTDRATTTALGVPDFIIFQERQVLICECKVGSNKMTVEQNAVAAWLGKLGQCVYTVRSVDDFMSILRDQGYK